MNPFLAGFLSELSKEALLIPKQGLRAAKAGVRIGERQAASTAAESVIGRPNAEASHGSSAARNLLRRHGRIPVSGTVTPRGGAPRAARPAASEVSPHLMARPLADAPAGRFMAVR
jgi:hypothetical protein